jgi:transposase
MLTVEDWMDIKDLHRQVHSIRSIAAQTGYARNTVRRRGRQRSSGCPGRRPRVCLVRRIAPWQVGHVFGLKMGYL